MVKRFLLIACFTVPGIFAWSQDTRPDSSSSAIDTVGLVFDADDDIDELLSDLDLFLDSLLAPRSYVVLSLSAGPGKFNYVVRSLRATIKEVRKIIWSPTFGYYDKSGLGITILSNAIHDTARFRPYQLSISPSFDYIKDRKLATGFSFTHYFTKKSVRFYTSPLQNELNGYFLWRKSWLQPGLTVNYGWGSKTSFSKRDTIYKTLLSSATTNVRDLVDLDTATIYQKNKRSVSDFSIAITLRHDFYWLRIFSDRDHIRLSPILSFSGGTQKFGFNKITSTNGPLRLLGVLNNSENVSFQDRFRPLSMTFYLRTEYSIGKFFIQPQFYFDYYFPAEKDNVTTAVTINTGFMF